VPPALPGSTIWHSIFCVALASVLATTVAAAVAAAVAAVMLVVQLQVVADDRSPSAVVPQYLSLMDSGLWRSDQVHLARRW
jgi:hypothetical protein